MIGTNEVPDMWWSPGDPSPFIRDADGRIGHIPGLRPIWETPLPKDARKLEDAEALRANLRKAISIYFDVDADDPRTDGGELELVDAIRALEAVRAVLDRE